MCEIRSAPDVHGLKSRRSARFDEARSMDNHIGAVHERVQGLLVRQVTQHDLQLQASELRMIDRLPSWNTYSPNATTAPSDYVATQKTRSARNCDNPTNDERRVWTSGLESNPTVTEAACCSVSPSNEARYMARALMRLILPEDVRGRALCETSTTEQFKPAVVRMIEATAVRSASRGTGSNVRHCNRITTRSASCSSTEKATTSPRRTPSM